jgi:deoxyribodipyrimidine photolyase-related protein
MSVFLERVSKAAPTKSEARDRRWMYVSYDRLTDRAGPLQHTVAAESGIVMVESLEKGMRRPYHKKKLALLLANERHFALEQAARGVKVIYIFTRKSFGEGLLEAQRKYELQPITLMRPAERELRLDLDQARARGLKLNEVEDSTWLTSEAEFDEVFGITQGTRQGPFLMDRFYRAIRKRSGLLMAGGKPVGGKFSFDHENRKPYRGEVPVPDRPSFAPDAITAEVLQLVARQFPTHFGTLDGFDLAVTAKQARASWSFVLTHLLPYFGPWEDAMSSSQPDLFHSKISALMNLSRVLPREAVDDVAAAQAEGNIPLPSAEGFIRQVLGWREFMRHVHRATDGYRNLPVPYQKSAKGMYAGAAPTALQATRPLPAVYWGVPSGLHCIDTVVGQVVREGWSHHITRLMVLSNLATLCGFSPRELTDWFWIAYVDAYDWVVESNVLGMATFSDGGVTATKPYVSGAAYINRMSDYCKDCRFDPARSTGPGSCPFTALYWSFLERNSDQLSRNQRLAMPYATLRKKTAGERKALHERADEAIDALQKAPRPSYEGALQQAERPTASAAKG